MVSLGFMAKGYRMREDQHRQEAAQKSAMDFKREQFEFTKSAHAETLQATKDKLLATRKAKEDTDYIEAVTRITGKEGNRKLPITPESMSSRTFARLIASPLVKPVMGTDGKVQYYPSENTAAFASEVLKARTTVEGGGADINQFDAVIAKKLITGHPQFKDIGYDKTKALFETNFKNAQTAKNQKAQADLIGANSKIDRTGLVYVKDAKGMVISAYPSQYMKYAHIVGTQKDNIIRRNMSDVGLWNSHLEDAEASGDKGLYTRLIAQTPKHIQNKFHSLGQSGTNTNIAGSDGYRYDVKQSQYTHLARNFKHLLNNTELKNSIASEHKVSPEAVDVAVKRKVVLLNQEEVDTGEFNPKRSPNADQAPVPKKVTIYKVDSAALKEIHKELKQTGKPENDVTLNVVNSDDNSIAASPTQATTENEKFTLGAVILPQIAMRNPEGVYITPEFKQFQKINPNLSKEQLLKAIQQHYKPLTDALAKYNRSSTPENLLETMEIYKLQDQYAELDDKKIQDIILEHKKNRVLDTFKPLPRVVQVNGVRQSSGYAGSIIKRRGNDLDSQEKARIKANNSSKDKIAKLKPMLSAYKRAKNTIDLLQAYQNGSITDTGSLNLVRSLAKSPYLLEMIKTKDRNAYDKLMVIAETNSFSADIFSSIDRVIESTKNIFNSVSYISNALTGSNLVESAYSFSGNQIDINRLKAPTNENAKGWENRVGSKLRGLRGLIQEEQKQVDNDIRNAATEIGRAQAVARGEMLMLRTSMTYYYAGLVQGESGGRAISNEDFENIYNALWAKGVGGALADGALVQLEATLNGIERRSKALHESVGYGPKGDTTYEDMLVSHERNVEKLDQAKKLRELQAPRQLSSAGIRQRGVPKFITLVNADNDDEKAKGVKHYNTVTKVSKTNLVEFLKTNNLQPQEYKSYTSDQQKSINRALLAGLIAGPPNMATEDMMNSAGIPANNVTMFNNLSKDGNLGDLLNKAIKKDVNDVEANIVYNVLKQMFDHMTTRGA